MGIPNFSSLSFICCPSYGELSRTSGASLMICSMLGCMLLPRSTILPLRTSASISESVRYCTSHIPPTASTLFSSRNNAACTIEYTPAFLTGTCSLILRNTELSGKLAELLCHGFLTVISTSSPSCTTVSNRA